MRTGACIGLLAAALLGGCASDNAGGVLYTYTGGGQSPNDVSDSFDVPRGDAHIAVSAGGTGTARVTIHDGRGAAIYAQTFSGQGGATQSNTLTGSAGQWGIEIDFTNWQGGFTVTITSR